TQGRTHEGTGIGLALVQELVQLHSGTIRVESEPGQGSRFIVCVPLGTRHLPQDRISSQTRPLAGQAPGAAAFVEEALRWIPEADAGKEPVSGASKHVLLADDNADMRDYVRRLLERDYQVTAVSDGQQALTAARKKRPDLVLTDIMMPVLDGIGLLRAIRGDPALRTVPVILLSARAGEEAKASGIELGADDYLTKPFSAKEMLARIRTQLQMAEVREQSIRKEVRTAELERLLQ